MSCPAATRWNGSAPPSPGFIISSAPNIAAPSTPAWSAILSCNNPPSINGGSTGPLSATGEKVFAELGCATCHRSDTQGRGPNLHGVFGHPVQLEDGRTLTADENYIRECIMTPGGKRLKGFQPIMPTFQGLVSEEQVNALVAYIKSLSGDKPGDLKTTASLAVSPKASEDPIQAQSQTNDSPVTGSKVQ
jgi:cytochrome c2